MDSYPKPFEYTLIGNLVKSGIRHFCIAPGSRSTPLVAAAHHHPLAKTLVHYDERGLAFFALGMAKALGKSVAIITTSGTACGNLLPAAMEAKESSIPLLFLTCDRPSRLQGSESNQTCDQADILGKYALFSQTIDPSIPVHTVASISSYVASIGQGPTHLNCRFDEPFLQNIEPVKPPYVGHFRSKQIFSDEQVLHLAGTLSRYEHGLIMLGEIPKDMIESIRALSRKLNWPIYTDISSPMRSAPIGKFHVPFTPGQPLEDIDCVLQLGSPFVSKSVRLFFENHKIKEHIVVSEKEKRIDPYASVTQRYIGPIHDFIKHVSQNVEVSSETKWFESWQTTLNVHDDLFTPLSQKNLQGVQLYIGNSMAIRRANNALYPIKEVPLYASRGLSGIDGQIATACGLAHATSTPTIAIIGDQTYLHDLNSLALINKITTPLLLIVLNNGGGSIFSKLPVGQTSLYEEYFFNKQTYNLKCGAEIFNISSSSIDTFLENPVSGFIELKVPSHEEAHL